MATGPPINAKIIKESVPMAHSQLEMGLINHATGDINSILDGYGGGCWVGGVSIGKSI